MLTQDEQNAFDTLVDGEGYAQVEGFCEKATVRGVELALSIVHHEPRARRDALRYLYRFSNWQDFALNTADCIQMEKWDEEEEDEA